MKTLNQYISERFISKPNVVVKVKDYKEIDAYIIKKYKVAQLSSFKDENTCPKDLDLTDIEIEGEVDLTDEFSFFKAETIDISNWNINIIDEYCFSDTELITFTMPETVKVIGESAFNGSKKLKTIILSDILTEIGTSAFKQTGLKKIKLPDTIESMGAAVFKSCAELESANIPSKLTFVPATTFANCTNLNSITLHDNIASIRRNAFAKCESLKTIKLPVNLRRINNYAFSESGLEEIEFPQTITYIENSAFANCKNLKKVKFHKDTDGTIERDVFNDCKNLEEIYIPDKLYINCIGPEIHDILKGCDKLKRIIGNKRHLQEILPTRLYDYIVEI